MKTMTEEFTTGGCSPSDCASCSGCSNPEGNCQDIEDRRTITLTLDDDTEVECAILTIFPVDAKEYIALLPLDENGQNQNGEVYLYTFARTESGDPVLSNIESDEEYNKAAIAFDTVLQNAKDSMEKIETYCFQALSLKIVKRIFAIRFATCS